MWSPTSLNQTRPQPSPALWKPAVSRTGGTGLPAWESFPALERQEFIEALVRTARRQYGLAERAQALGWTAEQITIIDEDQGKSGAGEAAAHERSGFAQLASAVGLGEVGLILVLEVSRLARNSVEWYRLLELAALAGVLIADEDGIYDPRAFNDRLLLGLRGTISEVELHCLQARLQGARLSK